jgi:hypothetical protein
MLHNKPLDLAVQITNPCSMKSPFNANTMMHRQLAYHLRLADVVHGTLSMVDAVVLDQTDVQIQTAERAGLQILECLGIQPTCDFPRALARA